MHRFDQHRKMRQWNLAMNFLAYHKFDLSVSPQDHLFFVTFFYCKADLCWLQGDISAGGGTAPTEARPTGHGGTKVSLSVSIVRPPLGSTSSTLGVNSAACSADCSGVTDLLVQWVLLQGGFCRQWLLQLHNHFWGRLLLRWLR